MTLKTFKSDLLAVQYMIQKSGESSWALEKSTGISRQTIDRWIKADSLKLRRSVLSEFAKKMQYNIEYNQGGIAVSPHTVKTNNTGDLTMNQQNRLIEYQDSEIKQLKAENRLLKNSNSNSLDDSIDTEYQFSMECRFEIDLKKLSVNMQYVKATSSFDYIVKRLGYSKDTLINDIFCFGQSINYKEHPVHLLRSKDAKKAMLKVATNIVKSMVLSKGAMYAYNLKVPVTYQTKDGLPVHAMNQYLVDWVSKTAVANIHFMNGIA